MVPNAPNDILLDLYSVIISKASSSRKQKQIQRPTARQYEENERPWDTQS